VFYMSGYSDRVGTAPDLERARVQLLTKPFSTHELASAVRQAIDG